MTVGATLGRLSTTAKVMPVVALVAFFFRITTLRTSSSNGRLMSCSYVDFFALFVAFLCIVGGVDVLRRGLRPGDVVERKVTTWHLVIGAALLILGVVHALRGFGYLGGPCP